MFHRVIRGRLALVVGLVVVMLLAQQLHERHIALYSGLGALISLPVLVATAVLLSLIMHG